MKKVITIAGSDPSSGAGIQADLKTFAAHEVYGLSVITAITSQNSTGVKDIYYLPTEIIESQIYHILDDIHIDFGKIGMLGNSKIIESVSAMLNKFNFLNIVLDPVMVSKNGTLLLDENALNSLYEKLFPIIYLITPNIPEAEKLSAIKINNSDDMKKAAKKIQSMGPKNVLIKGGHMVDSKKSKDILLCNSNYFEFESERIFTKNTHGTGCTLSSSICANLALGNSLPESIKLSKNYIVNAIENSFELGKGFGSTHHFYKYYKYKREED